jgi:hypothetical protein
LPVSARLRFAAGEELAPTLLAHLDIELPGGRSDSLPCTISLCIAHALDLVEASDRVTQRLVEHERSQMKVALDELSTCRASESGSLRSFGKAKASSGRLVRFDELSALDPRFLAAGLARPSFTGRAFLMFLRAAAF